MSLYARDPAQPYNTRRRVVWEEGDSGYPYGADTAEELLKYPPKPRPCKATFLCSEPAFFDPKPTKRGRTTIFAWYTAHYCRWHIRNDKSSDPSSAKERNAKGSLTLNPDCPTPMCRGCESAPVMTRVKDSRLSVYSPDWLCQACHSASYRHGLTFTEKTYIWEAQGRKCAGCGDTLSWEDIHIDHDHSKGCHPRSSESCNNCRRGFLHEACNLTLGKMGDDPRKLRALASFLEAYRDN